LAITKKNQKAESMMALVDLHACYQEAVQQPKREARNLRNIFLDCQTRYLDERPRMPLVLREDFCGTAVLCREWVAGHVERTAIGVDLDSAVLNYARDHFPSDSIASRVQLIKADVLTVDNDDLEPADIVAALNYGICYFHQRTCLSNYLQRSLSALAEGGVLIVDIFGGNRPLTEPWLFRRQCSTFDYWFEQSPCDLLTNVCQCSINFKFRDGTVKRPAFVYEFRLWSLAEVLEAFREAGFAHVDVWVSQSTPEAAAGTGLSGTGDFERIDGPFAPEGSAWNAYVVGFKE
jgi:SAM-dependent methyltransferase